MADKSFIVETEMEGEVCFIPLPEEVMDNMGLSVGDFVELRDEDGLLCIEKVEVVDEDVELDEETIEMVKKYRDSKGYATFEEALSNMVRDGLSYYLRKEDLDEDLAERLEKSHLVQVVEAE